MSTITDLVFRTIRLRFTIISESKLDFEKHMNEGLAKYPLKWCESKYSVLEQLREDAAKASIPLDIGKTDDIGYDEDGQWWWGGEFEHPDDLVGMNPDSFAGIMVAVANLAAGSVVWERVYKNEVII